MDVGLAWKSKTQLSPAARAFLGLKPKRRTGPSAGERLQAAYEKGMAKRAKG
jgi:hypothetical protein